MHRLRKQPGSGDWQNARYGFGLLINLGVRSVVGHSIMPIKHTLSFLMRFVASRNSIDKGRSGSIDL